LGLEGKNETGPVCDALERSDSFQNQYGPSVQGMYTYTRGKKFGPRKESQGVGLFVGSGSCSDITANSCENYEWLSSGSSTPDVSSCGSSGTKVLELNGQPTLTVSSACRSWYDDTDVGDQLYIFTQLSENGKKDQCARSNRDSPTWTSAGWIESGSRRYACIDISVEGLGFTVNTTFMDDARNGSAFSGLRLLIVSIGNAPCKGPSATASGGGSGVGGGGSSDTNSAGRTAHLAVGITHQWALFVVVTVGAMHVFAERS